MPTREETTSGLELDMHDPAWDTRRPGMSGAARRVSGGLRVG